MPHISVVSPVYMGGGMVHELVTRVKENVSKLTDDFDIILVNDASPDLSWQMILKECAADKRVKGINLSRNFGQHRAITAGLNYAKGDWVVVMDCDLQDRPEEIAALYSKAKEGYDVVQGERVERKDTFLKRWSSVIFHYVFDWLTGIQTNNKIGNFGVYKQDVILQILKMPERDRDFTFMTSYVGFKTIAIPIEHGARLEGKSSYNLNRLLKLAFDCIISNTNKPLKMMVEFGFVMSLLSLLMAAYNVVAYFIGFINVAGFTTTVFSIWFVGGLIMAQLGIVGLYIGKIFDQVKGRPLYIVMDEINVIE